MIAREKLLAAATAAAAMFVGSAASAAVLFSSVLTGDQEVPPSGSPYTGTASYILRTGGALGPALDFDILVDPNFDFDLPDSTGTQQVLGLHIHQAPSGVNGPVVFGIISPDDDLDDDVELTVLSDGSTRITGTWDADEGRIGSTFSDFASDFENAARGEYMPFYLNLHTDDFRGGEIRGQIVAAQVPLPASLPMLAGGILLVFSMTQQVRGAGRAGDGLS
jgi:serralysin